MSAPFTGIQGKLREIFETASAGEGTFIKSETTIATTINEVKNPITGVSRAQWAMRCVVGLGLGAILLTAVVDPAFEFSSRYFSDRSQADARVEIDSDLMNGMLFPRTNLSYQQQRAADSLQERIELREQLDNMKVNDLVQPSYQQQRAADSLQERIELREQLDNMKVNDSVQPSYQQQRAADSLQERIELREQSSRYLQDSRWQYHLALRTSSRVRKTLLIWHHCCLNKWVHLDIPVIAAGGIADGRGLAAVLMLGSESAWIGTRFVASHEASRQDWEKELLVQSGTDDTILVKIYDLIRGSEFPADVGHRILRNRFVEEWHGREQEAIVPSPPA